MRGLVAHLTDEVIAKAFEGANFGRTDFRVILAEVVLKKNCGYHCGHTATTIAAELGLITSRRKSQSGHNAGWKSTAAGHEFAMETYYSNHPGSIVRQLKVANARVAELEGYEQDMRDAVRDDHADWSQKTFGNVGPVGPLKHLSKEALEAAAEPGDLSEWADMQFLLWDAQRRAGITDDAITQAMIDKLEVNKSRSWPEPKDGEPRLHIKGDTS